MSIKLIDHPKGKVVALQSRMNSLIHAMYPRSRIVDDTIYLPFTLDAMQAAAQAGARVISPILKEYDFPGSKTPFRHQYKICSFLTTNKRAYCFADMGTGKSLACVWAADYLLRIGAIKRVLVVAPISVMVRTWSDEFFHVNPANQVTVLYGTKAEREARAANNSPIHIINYDGLKVIENEIRYNNYDLVIIDECTTYGESGTSRWKVAQSLFKDTPYVWGLTGTPTLRGVEYAYGQAALITPATVKGVSKYKFKERVLRQVSTYTWVERPDAHDQVAKVLKPAIRVRKQDCIDLPPVTHLYREVELSAEQADLYARLKSEQFVGNDEVSITASNGAILMNKLIQIATGAIYDDSGEARSFNVNNRIKETMDFIDRARAESSDPMKGKTLVFVPFKHTALMLQAALNAEKFNGQKKYQTRLILGDTSAKERDNIFAAFQNELHPDVIIATPQTMSHGVTATSASCIVWFGPTTSAETYVQACNRIDRPGQRNDMTIVHLYSTPVEWKLYRSLQQSKVSQADLLKMYKDFIAGV